MNINNELKAQLELIAQYPELKFDSYFLSYPYLISFFRDKLLTTEILVQGIHLVYGWMPTTLELGFSKDVSAFEGKIRECLHAIENARKTINEGDLKIISYITNNSLIGATKLLHFIYPETYPIWDTKVSNILTGEYWHYQVNKPKRYIEYLEIFETNYELSERLKASYDTHLLEKHNLVNYPISRVRALEMSLFNCAKQFPTQKPPPTPPSDPATGLK